ncbi:hypothetical protein PINS_up018237 [Pythium insidiosum]|nr:hypothetical protein PINS_up018237 [Pythium insidiosum]
MGLVCFYVSFGGRELNEALLRRVNESGKIFLIHSVVDGVHFLRLAMGGLEVDDWTSTTLSRCFATSSLRLLARATSGRSSSTAFAALHHPAKVQGEPQQWMFVV